MSDNTILALIILMIAWGIFYTVDSLRIENLNDRIKKLEEQTEEYTPVPRKRRKGD